MPNRQEVQKTAGEIRAQRELGEKIINYEPRVTLQQLPEIEALAEALPWPKKAAPKPIPIKNGKPTSAFPDKNRTTSPPLPRADIVAVTWTVAEGFALGDVLTPGFRDVRPKKKNSKASKTSSKTKPWYYYRPENFESDYIGKLRKTSNAVKTGRLGSYYMTSIPKDESGGTVKLLCFKSELHLNRDWIKSDLSYRTMPVADLFVQIIREVQPKLIITVGTAGATLGRTALGDVIVTRAAKFRLSKAFKGVPFDKKTYTCTTLTGLTDGQLKATPPLLERYKSQLDPKVVKRTPKIWCDGNPKSFSKDFPILTTDGFEFGTSKGKNGNYLGGSGCGVEMGDAVLGMVIQYLEKPTKDVPWEFAAPESLEAAKERVPKWLVIRNASDPQIDASKSKADQRKDAYHFYTKYGYFTSLNSAIAVWAAVRSLRI